MRDTNCQRCSLFKTARSVCVPSVGSCGSLYFVGESPGQSEDIRGEPFVGRAGQLLTRALNAAGISRDDVRIGNAARCFSGTIQRKPTTDEVKVCVASFLSPDLERSKPLVVVALGAIAFAALAEHGHGAKQGYLAQCGQGVFIDNKVWKGWVMPAAHPAGVLRNASWWSKLLEPIKAARDLAARLSGKAVEEKIPERVNRWSDPAFKSFIFGKNAPSSVTFDLETTGLDPLMEDARIRCAVACDTNESDDLIALVSSQTSLYRLWESVCDPSAVSVGHNVGFDLRWLYRCAGRWTKPYDIECLRNGSVGPFADTMIAHHLLNENDPHGLKALAWKYTDWGGYEPSEGNPTQWDDATLFPYAVMDARVTRALAQRFFPRIESAGLGKVFKLTMDVLPVLAYMELRGIEIDIKKAVKQAARRNEEAESVTEELRAMLARRFESKPWIDRFNPASPKQTSNIFYAKLGVDPPKDQPVNTKQLSVRKSMLEALASERDDGVSKFAAKMLEFRKAAKIGSTVTGMIERMTGNPAFLRTSYLLHGTRTGRLSSRDPNLQNVPNDETKELFIARKGMTLVEADFSQIELRVAAWIAEDQTMLRMLEDRASDIHQQTADLLGCSRKIAKNTNFATIYGASAIRIAATSGCTEDDAKKFRDRYMKEFVGIRQWMDKTRSLVTRQRFVKSPFGRKRRLPEIASRDQGKREHAYRESLNSPIQGTASDITLLALVETARRIPEAYPVWTVHDSIGFEVETKNVKKIAKRIRDVMEALPIVERFGVVPPVPFYVDLKAGKTWADMEEIE